MKINFNLDTSTSDIPSWVDTLVKEFLNYYHIDGRVHVTNVFLWSPQGVKIITEWFKNRGFDIEYWQLDYLIPDKELDTPIAYGISINESCPKVVEYKLKFSEVI